MRIGTPVRRAGVAVAVAATALTGATAVTAATARPAHATAVDCEIVLSIDGYTINSTRAHGCSVGGSGQIGAWIFCDDILVGSGVASSAAGTACTAAESA